MEGEGRGTAKLTGLFRVGNCVGVFCFVLGLFAAGFGGHEVLRHCGLCSRIGKWGQVNQMMELD